MFYCWSSTVNLEVCEEPQQKRLATGYFAEKWDTSDKLFGLKSVQNLLMCIHLTFCMPKPRKYLFKALHPSKKTLLENFWTAHFVTSPTTIHTWRNEYTENPIMKPTHRTRWSGSWRRLNWQQSSFTRHPNATSFSRKPDTWGLVQINWIVFWLWSWIIGPNSIA